MMFFFFIFFFFSSRRRHTRYWRDWSSDVCSSDLHRLLRSRRGPMLSLSYSISPKDLWNAIATPSAPQLVDVRRRDAYEQSPQLLPGALWRDAGKTQAWSADFDRTPHPVRRSD